MTLSERLGNAWKAVTEFAGYRDPQTRVKEVGGKLGDLKDRKEINYSAFYRGINEAARIRQEEEEVAMFDGGKQVFEKGQWVDPGNGKPVQV